MSFDGFSVLNPLEGCFSSVRITYKYYLNSPQQLLHREFLKLRADGQVGTRRDAIHYHRRSVGRLYYRIHRKYLLFSWSFLHDCLLLALAHEKALPTYAHIEFGCIWYLFSFYCPL
jgi:hypothetical protein